VDDTRRLFVPTEIQKLTINTMQHIAYLQSLDMNAERGEFQLCFYCTCSRGCIDFISFSSIVMRCVVDGHVFVDVLDCSTFKTFVTSCPGTYFRISENEYS
jgi:hypothetical protein